MSKRDRIKRARKGGEARAVNLTSERRQEIARTAAATRWAHRMVPTQVGTTEAAA